MSEEIHIEQTLSTTEDAFENFQAAASSAYQDENEFITLSDIVPPTPQLSDLSAELNEIPFDNEVVLSNYDEATTTSNIIDTTGVHSTPTQDASAAGHQNDGISRELKFFGTSSKTQRVAPQCMSDGLDIGGQDSDCNEILIQDSVLSTTVGQGNSTETSQDVPQARRTRRQNVANSNKYPNTNINSKNNTSTKRRRGRPRKSSYTLNNQAEPDSTNTENVSQVTPEKCNVEKNNISNEKLYDKTSTPVNLIEKPNNQTPKRPRGRPRKDVSQISESSSNADLVKNKEQNKFKDSLHNGTKELIQHVMDDKCVSTKEDIEDKHNKPDSDSDDGDNVSLSMFKKNTENVKLNKLKENVTTNVDRPRISPENEECHDKSTETAKTDLTESTESKLTNVTQDECFMQDSEQKNVSDDSSLLVENTSKRPNRRKTKKTFHYDDNVLEDDPFANMESSDEKGDKYYSDDDYVPFAKTKKTNVSSDSEINYEEEAGTKKKRKRLRKKSNTVTPRKKGKKCHEEGSPDVTIVNPDGEVEKTIKPSVVKTDLQSKSDETYKRPAEAWASSNEFENFIVQKINKTNTKIKKVSTTEKSEKPVVPLSIPVIEQNTIQKIESSTQTTTVKTQSVALQTTSPYDIPMKINVPLTKKQSESACNFLNSIVQTTVELGQLMTQKSEDFMKKKINTTNVIDSFKMDYCVKKSFLLFKLAKHNLMQMEDDLAKQYDEFLKENNLSPCREAISVKTSNIKDSDSDCEIVDEEKVEKPMPAHAKSNPAFNSKTVFLNKELSIKIAKKPTSTPATSASAAKKLDIKTRHAVWLSDSVMVKKVKPDQSFLDQDSRNKKPPDTYVTQKMVSDFFVKYYRQRAIRVCAPFISKEWINVQKEYACHYFVQFEDLQTSVGSGNMSNMNNIQNIKTLTNPKSLLLLCIDTVHQNLNIQQMTREISNVSCNIPDNKSKKEPLSLFRMCMDTLTCYNPAKYDSVRNTNIFIEKEADHHIAKSLKSLCHKKLVDLIDVSKNTETSVKSPSKNEFHYEITNVHSEYDEDTITEAALSDHQEEVDYSMFKIANSYHTENILPHIRNNLNVKPLLILSLEMVQSMLKISSCKNRKVKSLLTLSLEVFQRVKVSVTKCYHCVKYNENFPFKVPSLQSLTHRAIQGWISCNDTTEEEYSNQLDNFTINCVNTLTDEAFRNLQNPNVEDEIIFSDATEFDGDNDEDEFSHHFTPDSEVTENIIHTINMSENNTIIEEKQTIIMSQIKIEPIDDYSENVDPSIVKTEPQGLDEMIMIPENIVTKIEPEHTQAQSPDLTAVAVCDANSFENFVRGNKMIHSLEENSDDEIFSQSALRVRRQHEPDFEEDNDMNMSLLIPQTYEPLNIENAKGSLMKSSSENESCDAKKSTKKKNDKRKKIARKDLKSNKSKEVPKIKTNNNEVAVLTRRMRDKIRQEEKMNESSDSETELLPNLKKKKDTKLKITTDKTSVDDEIQCSNVDSTDNHINSTKKNDSFEEAKDHFTGFTAIDQNEISIYQKYMKFVFDKIANTENNGKQTQDKINEKVTTQKSSEDNVVNTENERSDSPLINLNEPIELLECEPTIPSSIRHQYVKEVQNKEGHYTNTSNPDLNFMERHGWHCYPFDSNDAKLYQNPQIILEKLPETFVETYLQYQAITNKNDNDEEVERLINLQSLTRPAGKESKIKSKPKAKISKADQIPSTSYTSRSPSPAGSDLYHELTPSEDEGIKVKDEISLSVPLHSTENILAKNSLMDDDNDSDSELLSLKKTKKQVESEVTTVPKPGPKSKTKANAQVGSDSLMLTADRMMNKELEMLHAPVILQNDLKSEPVEEATVKESRKNKQKKEHKSLIKDRIKVEDDSSSEEEKLWVNTKEKLLKRLDKKGNASLDDAKNIKLVNEFIERRNELKDRKKRPNRRSRKKFLERQKQLKVLSKELLGEGSGNASHMTKRAGQSVFKGRKNIRKVIDKKSLARSTVIANMEEFERKRRLNIRQQKLREITGCEEDVNVLVINDEVCLEYDFEQHRPAVTVHSFFTRVMKAHQYEGVKFMWDACFESLEHVESGHPGSGCILAHCMGLGKTLQVLALLHTVLTHPRVGIKRVLVCCPLSTVLNWVDEIHKWLGPVTDQIKVFELSKLRKTYERAYQLEDWYNGGGIFIIGYELFRSLTTLDPVIDDVRPTIVNKIRKALLDPGPDIIICDEGHLLKNDCSVLAVAMSRVVTKRRIVLTGTPMQNNLREYYCMVNFVKPNLLGTYSEYSNRFENPIMNGQHRDSRQEDIKLMKARTHILHKVLEGCLQRQEASVLYPYLPKKHEYTVFISMTKCQWDLYKHYLNNYGNKSKQSVLKDFHILQKIWSHPQVLHKFQTKARDSSASKIKIEKLEDDLALEDNEDIKPTDTEVWWLQYLDGGKMLDSLDSSNKFVAVFRILHECNKLGDKVLIFSTSLFSLDALEFFLKRINNWNLGQEYYRLDGSVPPEVRQKWCREFNAEHNKKTKLFLISTRAGCLGLNMTAANRVIILDTSWNPAHDIQSIFRVYRFGQKKDCYIYRLVAMGTMEQKIYERSVTKQAVACRVVDEQQIDRHYNMSELNELYKFDESGAQVAGGVAVGVSDVALLRVARDAALHAVHEHDSLLRGGAEPALPEHERNAAWNQFQQEHAGKQIQNEIDARIEALKAEPPAAPVEAQPPPKKSEERKRRGRLKRTTPQAILDASPDPASDVPPPAPDAPSPDEDLENALVRRITEILLEHKFTDSVKRPKEISSLVSSVRRSLSCGETCADSLTARIAHVLQEYSGPTPPPPCSDATPLESSDSVEPPGTSRKRRKAALAAEVQFDSLSQDSVIDLDDDEWSAKPNDATPDGDSVSAPTVVSVCPDKKKKIGPKSRMVGPKCKKNKINKPVESIVLSDDESPIKPPIQTDPQVPPIPEPELQMTAKKIPLEPSLLTNQNFIKIVAHTYLSGNPMLDEDAAMLAAQYSTLKAMKEVESTGADIVEGPIYDIAVKVLGIDILKKLHISKSRGSNVASELQSMFGESSSKSSEPVAGNQAEKSKARRNVSKIATHKPKTRDIIPFQILGSSICIDDTEMRSESNKEECILPDSTDVPSSCTAVKGKPILIRKVLASAHGFEKKTGVVVRESGTEKAGSTSPARADTICLDSDEEEPVPVALTGPAPPPVVPGPTLPQSSRSNTLPTSSPSTLVPSYHSIPLKASSQPSLMPPEPFLPALAPSLVTPNTNTSVAAPSTSETSILPSPSFMLLGPRPVRLTCVSKGAPPKLLSSNQPNQSNSLQYSSKAIPVPDTNVLLVPIKSTDSKLIKLAMPPSTSQSTTHSVSLPANPTPVTHSTTDNVKSKLNYKPTVRVPKLYKLSSTGRIEVIDNDDKKANISSMITDQTKEPNQPSQSISSSTERTKTIQKIITSKKSSDTKETNVSTISRKDSPTVASTKTRNNSSKSLTIELEEEDQSDPLSKTKANPLDILKNVVRIQAPTASKPIKLSNSMDSQKLHLKQLDTPKKDIQKTLVKKIDLTIPNSTKEIDLKRQTAPEKHDTLQFAKNTKSLLKETNLTKLRPSAASSTVVRKQTDVTKTTNTFGIQKLQKNLPAAELKNMNFAKPKTVDKRPAPPTTKVETKKKKRSLMTLKDFNIDDIDDIIELD